MNCFHIFSSKYFVSLYPFYYVEKKEEKIKQKKQQNKELKNENKSIRSNRQEDQTSNVKIKINCVRLCVCAL